jgi:hypothetical protein
MSQKHILASDLVYSMQARLTTPVDLIFYILDEEVTN